jgi:DNA-binding transcriptional ArsR family regulator
MDVKDDRRELDTVFVALANEHRRAMVEALALHPNSISQLAKMRGLSLPAIHKHIGILESAGLVARRKTGRTTFLTLRREALGVLQAWTSRFHLYWGSEAETLANYERYLVNEETP